jgi:hypothetical protein
LGEVLQQDPDMHRRFLQYPRENVRRLHPACLFLIPAVSALIKHQVPMWERIAEKLAHDENPEFMNLKTAGSAETTTRKLHVGFEGQMGTHVCSAHLPL